MSRPSRAREELVSLIDASAADVEPEMVAVRRDIHAHPELGWQEFRTSALVASRLERAGLTPSPLPRGTGLTCDVLGDPSGPLVALRGDLDALPLGDEKDVAYRSTNPGVAHACGHDVHTSVVLGAGLVLSRLAAKGHLPGRVRLIFQPAEELLPGGALAVIESGALEGVQRAFALHCDPRHDSGTVALRSGPITGATDSISVVLSGPGGHTARPQLTVDVVAALAEVVSRSPTVLSRRVDPRAGLSLVWATLAAGTAANVIPETARASGSVRVLDREVWGGLEDLVTGIVRDIAAPYRAQVELTYVRGVPPAVNDPEVTQAFRRSAASILGSHCVLETPQSMGAEDFAWFLDRVPGVLARLGVRRPGQREAPDLHRGDFDIDESAIGCGSRVLAAAAFDSLIDLHMQEEIE